MKIWKEGSSPNVVARWQRSTLPGPLRPPVRPAFTMVAHGRRRGQAGVPCSRCRGGALLANRDAEDARSLVLSADGWAHGQYKKLQKYMI